MADLETKFQKAVEDVRKLQAKPTPDELLKIYALFKQATIGVNNTPPPSSFLDFVGKRKHEAWKNLGDMTQDEAKEQYIETVKILISTYGIQN